MVRTENALHYADCICGNWGPAASLPEMMRHYRKWLVCYGFWSHLLQTYELARRTRTFLCAFHKQAFNMFNELQICRNVWSSNVVKRKLRYIPNQIYLQSCTLCYSFQDSWSLITANENSLWSPYVIGQTIIFLPCDFYLLSSSVFFLFLA